MQLTETTVRQFEILLRSYGLKVHELELTTINFKRKEISAQAIITQMEAIERELQALVKYFSEFDGDKMVREMQVHESFLQNKTYVQFTKELRAPEIKTTEIISKIKKAGDEIKLIASVREFNTINNEWLSIFNHVAISIGKIAEEFRDLMCFDDRHYPAKIKYFFSKTPAAETLAVRCMSYIASAYNLLSHEFAIAPKVQIYILSPFDWERLRLKLHIPAAFGSPMSLGEVIIIPDHAPENPLKAQLEGIMPMLGTHELTHTFFKRKPFVLFDNWLHEEIIANIIAFQIGRMRERALEGWLKYSINAGMKHISGATMKKFIIQLEGAKKLTDPRTYVFAQTMIFQGILDYYKSHGFGGLQHDSNLIHKNILQIRW